MKKLFMMFGLAALSLGFVACDDNDSEVESEGHNLNVTSENIKNWTEYTYTVSKLLSVDAQTLNDAWTQSYKGGEAFATTFKTPNANKTYKTYADCIVQIVEGCIDIAGEVGASKIGEPYDLWTAGKKQKALYAVESWYSYHSIDDYANNIRSIRNAFNGTRDETEAANSIASYLQTNNPTLYETLKQSISDALESIDPGMAAPFRNHIDDPSVPVAMQACAALGEVLETQVKNYFNDLNDEANLKLIVETYVDDVVVPTYADLVTRTAALAKTIDDLRENPSSRTFAAAAYAWLDAREPWESSEAFLFGPVADLGLDPNMDSWPLDVDAINITLKNGKFSSLNWESKYTDYIAEPEDEEEEAEMKAADKKIAASIAAAQNIRGFHTLEFLLFKDGEPRSYGEEEEK